MALDSSSIAAAHVSALAALVLAHHPDFQAGHHDRGPARVDRLMYLLRASGQPLALGTAHPVRMAQMPLVGLNTVPPQERHPEVAIGTDPTVALTQLTAAMHSAGLSSATESVSR
jgi:hypothetical protein